MYLSFASAKHLIQEVGRPTKVLTQKSNLPTRVVESVSEKSSGGRFSANSRR